MPYQTANVCAAYIERRFRMDLDAGATNFSAVQSNGRTVTVDYDIDSTRADFPRGRVADGRTLDQWTDDELVDGLRESACDELDHRAFVRMGGTMVHRYRFSDGEVLREVVIDSCP